MPAENIVSVPIYSQVLGAGLGAPTSNLGSNTYLSVPGFAPSTRLAHVPTSQSFYYFPFWVDRPITISYGQCYMKTTATTQTSFEFAIVRLDEGTLLPFAATAPVYHNNTSIDTTSAVLAGFWELSSMGATISTPGLYAQAYRWVGTGAPEFWCRAGASLNGLARWQSTAAQQLESLSGTTASSGQLNTTPPISWSTSNTGANAIYPFGFQWAYSVEPY